MKTSHVLDITTRTNSTLHTIHTPKAKAPLHLKLFNTTTPKRLRQQLLQMLQTKKKQKNQKNQRKKPPTHTIQNLTAIKIVILTMIQTLTLTTVRTVKRKQSEIREGRSLVKLLRLPIRLLESLKQWDKLPMWFQLNSQPSHLLYKTIFLTCFLGHHSQ